MVRLNMRGNDVMHFKCELSNIQSRNHSSSPVPLHSLDYILSFIEKGWDIYFIPLRQTCSYTRHYERTECNIDRMCTVGVTHDMI